MADAGGKDEYSDEGASAVKNQSSMEAETAESDNIDKETADEAVYFCVYWVFLRIMGISIGGRIQLGWVSGGSWDGLGCIIMYDFIREIKIGSCGIV